MRELFAIIVLAILISHLGGDPISWPAIFAYLFILFHDV